MPTIPDGMPTRMSHVIARLFTASTRQIMPAYLLVVSQMGLIGSFIVRLPLSFEGVDNCLRFICWGFQRSRCRINGNDDLE